MHEIGSYQEGGVKVVMVADGEYSLTHLYTQAVNRLMVGIAPNGDEALRELKAAYPKRVQEVIDELVKNYTSEGIAAFETAMRKGMKKIGMWEN